MAAKKRTYSSEPLGPTIERLMAATGVTYRALAEKTDLSAGYLNHIVHGNRPVPSNDVLGRFGNNDARWLDLVDAGVGGVQRSRDAIEAHLADNRGGQIMLQAHSPE